MGDEEYIESEDDEISDPEWKYGREYSEEEDTSESIGDMVINSDDAEWSDSDMEGNAPQKQRNRDDGSIDPNSNLPEAPSHIGPDGKINLQL